MSFLWNKNWEERARRDGRCGVARGCGAVRGGVARSGAGLWCGSGWHGVVGRRGFTLPEMIVAVAVFATLSLLGASAFTNISRMQKRITLENALLEDARFMMERMTRMIRTSTIDYEEYYNQNVLAEFLPNSDYGDNYGYYATMFYNPGMHKDQTPIANSTDGQSPTYGTYGAYYNGPGADFSNTDPNKLAATSVCRITKSDRKLDFSPGSVCPPDTTQSKSPDDPDYGIILQETVDYNMGVNPYADGTPGVSSYIASAFCDDLKGSTPACMTNSTTPNYNEHFQQNELYLIDQTGQQKYILARELVNIGPDHHVLSMLTLDGEDNNFNNISDNWVCNDDYNCVSSVLKNDLGAVGSKATNRETIYDDFVPISPLRSNIVDLKFFVAPLEDPRKGFSENENYPGLSLPEFMMQPHVTIVMTLRPADSEVSGIEGDIPEITLQTTVSSRVRSEVKSYGP